MGVEVPVIAAAAATAAVAMGDEIRMMEVDVPRREASAATAVGGEPSSAGAILTAPSSALYRAMTAVGETVAKEASRKQAAAERAEAKRSVAMVKVCVSALKDVKLERWNTGVEEALKQASMEAVDGVVAYPDCEPNATRLEQLMMGESMLDDHEALCEATATAKALLADTKKVMTDADAAYTALFEVCHKVKTEFHDACKAAGIKRHRAIGFYNAALAAGVTEDVAAAAVEIAEADVEEGMETEEQSETEEEKEAWVNAYAATTTETDAAGAETEEEDEPQAKRRCPDARCGSCCT